MKNKADYIEESIRFRWLQINAALNNIDFNTTMILRAEELLEGLYEEARIASIIKLCLTGK
jgi:hypothetical protein